MPIKEVISSQGVMKINETHLPKAQGACDKTIEIVANVINLLESGDLTQEQWGLLNQFFLLDPANRAIPGGMINILKTTLKGLREVDITLDIKYFNLTKFGSTTISIALAQFKNDNQLIRFFLHEATHAFANTRDFAESGYINNDGKYRLPGLDAESAAVNADSYAGFVVCCAGIALI